jgi:hypothetical protein
MAVLLRQSTKEGMVKESRETKNVPTNGRYPKGLVVAARSLLWLLTGDPAFVGLANFDGYAAYAEESQIRDFSVREGPTEYCRRVDPNDNENRAAARRFGGHAEYAPWWTKEWGCH